MKNLVLFFLLAALSFAGTESAAKAPSQKISIGRELPAFHTLKITGDIKVYLRPATSNSFSAELPSDLNEFFQASVENGVLTLSLNKAISRFDMPKVELFFSGVNTIEADGGYFLKMEETYPAESLNLNLKGSGLTNLNVEVASLKAEISGQAIASFRGRAAEARVYGSQESYWAGASLELTSALVSVNGSSKAEVNASGEVVAIVENTGIINCSGKAEIRSYIHGLGAVNKLPSL